MIPHSDIKYYISFSGGLGSAISALVAYENNLDFELVFADTLIEDEDLYRFIKEIAEAVDKEIIWLKDGRNVWEVFKDKKFMGNSRVAPCSSILKTKQVRDFLKDKPIENPIVLGMDSGELDRIERAQKVWSPRPVVSLLNQYKVYRPQYKTYLEKYKIQEPSLYQYGFPHNNCGGFCVRAGLKQFATLLEKKPEVYQYHEEQMEKLLKEVPTTRPFLQHNIKGVKHYLTLKEFREKYQANEIKVNPFDYGGCGCFIDDNA